MSLSNFRWFRKWRGGHWERHFIDICDSHIWLQMSNNPSFQWPAYRQPCSVGAPIVEDYPIKESGR